MKPAPGTLAARLRLTDSGRRSQKKRRNLTKAQRFRLKSVPGTIAARLRLTDSGWRSRKKRCI